MGSRKLLKMCGIFDKVDWVYFAPSSPLFTRPGSFRRLTPERRIPGREDDSDERTVDLNRRRVAIS